MKKKKLEKFNIYLIVVSMLTAWAPITTILLIGKYDILPLKYFIPLALILSLISALFIFLMLKKKIKPLIKKIVSGISITFVTILLILLFYLSKTLTFLDKINIQQNTTETYSVVVLNDSNYNTIDELKSKKLGYYNNIDSKIDIALQRLEDIVNTENPQYENYDALIESLYSKENDAILIEESYRGIIEETKENFWQDTKVIYKIEVEKEAVSIVKEADVNNETFNIFISGIDTYGKISSVSRSDVNIVVTINPKTHQILLTSIPRDYYVQLDGTTGYKDKLTHAGIYGVEKSIKTVENLLDIQINYYVKVNFSSLEKIVDALKGVEVYSQYSFIGFNGSSFKKGYNKVNGAQALEFARTRKTVSGGDRTRGENQEALIHAMINKACSKEIILKYTNILNSLDGSFQTNMSTEEIINIIKKQIDEMAKWRVTSISLDGSNSREYTYSYKGQKLYVMIPNEESITIAKEKIEEVVNGEILESSYIENNGNVYIPVQTYINEEPAPTDDIVEEPQETENKEELLENNDTSENIEIKEPEEIEESIENEDSKENEQPIENIIENEVSPSDKQEEQETKEVLEEPNDKTEEERVENEELVEEN